MLLTLCGSDHLFRVRDSQFWPSRSLFLAFFIAALGEELGWSGYITDPMQASLERAPNRHYIGVGMGRLARHPTAPGEPRAYLDRLVVSRYGGIAGAV